MRNDPSGNDPRKIWQNQPTEPSIMTLEKIRQKTRELHAKTRRALLGRMVTPLAVVFLSGYGVAWFDGPALRVGFALALAWSLAGQYFVHRGMWSAMPGDAALNTGLKSYRREVERRRYLYSCCLLWTFGPIVLALATFTASLLSLGIRNRGILLNMIPFLTLLVIWIVSIFFIRMRDQRELQREIDELNDIERANG
jgi:hypothetical protein